MQETSFQLFGKSQQIISIYYFDTDLLDTMILLQYVEDSTQTYFSIFGYKFDEISKKLDSETMFVFLLKL